MQLHFWYLVCPILTFMAEAMSFKLFALLDQFSIILFTFGLFFFIVPFFISLVLVFGKEILISV